jgi:hypothetical protein
MVVGGLVEVLVIVCGQSPVLAMGSSWHDRQNLMHRRYEADRPCPYSV